MLSVTKYVLVFQAKIAVLYRIGLFCRSNKFELLYENAKT